MSTRVQIQSGPARLERIGVESGGMLSAIYIQHAQLSFSIAPIFRTSQFFMFTGYIYANDSPTANLSLFSTTHKVKHLPTVENIFQTERHGNTSTTASELNNEDETSIEVSRGSSPTCCPLLNLDDNE